MNRERRMQKTHHAVLCRAFMVGWVPTALFLVSCPPPPIRAFYYSPFSFCPPLYP